MRFVILLLLLATLHANGQTPLGGFTGYAKGGKAITVQADTSAVRFIFYRSDILRIDYLPSPSSTVDSSFVVIRDTTESVPLSIQDSDSLLVISSSSIRMHCRKFPLRFSYFTSSGELLVEEPVAVGFTSEQAERVVNFSLRPRERFYGTGERGTSLDKRGQAFESYNTQIGGYSTPLATMNLNVPFLASTSGYALYFDNTFRGKFDLGASDTTRFSYTATGGELSYYLIAAPTIPGQLEKYTWLTGRQPLPPRWAFGYMQSKNRYQNEKEARATVDTLRAKQFPCDALVLDLRWFKYMGDLRWDRSSWPDPERMMSDFAAEGIKTVLITEPYIIDSSVNYAEAASNAYFARDTRGQPYTFDKWWSCDGCSAALLDMTNPDVRLWWWNKHAAFLGTEVAGIWTDLGEPERHPDEMQHHLGTAAKVHNIYNLLWAKTVFEGFNRLRPDRRVFNLTRSGFAGIQRYGAIPWSGDVARKFGGLAVQLPMLLNMGMSGLAYHNSDIGGYARNPTTPELYVRWMQYGTFCPIARAHGAGEVVKGAPTEPWAFGPEAERICRTYIQLRYQLLPYIYSMAHQNYETGMPLARPLFFAFPDDDNLYNESSSYLWGDALLVSPVVEVGQTAKELYLPAGRWYNFWTDELLPGKQFVHVSAPLERMPLFVKSGSIIPMVPPALSTAFIPNDSLFIHVYTGKDASFTLYEDDGTTGAYTRGEKRTMDIVFTQSVMSLNIAAGVGTYDHASTRRAYRVDFHGLVRPLCMEINGRPLKLLTSVREAIPAEEGVVWDREKMCLSVFVKSTPIASNVLVKSIGDCSSEKP